LNTKSSSHRRKAAFRQDKITDINAFKLYTLTKETILEAYGIPDVDLLKSLYEHTTVRLPERDMVIVKITFNTGVDQGSVLSPLLFSLFINTLSPYLTDIGRKKRIHHDLPGTHPFNHILFVDDMTLLAQDSGGT
jgi:hypothetical protein